MAFGLVSSALAAWPWGWSGLGLALATWSAAGMGFLVRHHLALRSGADGSTLPFTVSQDGKRVSMSSASERLLTK